MRSLAPPGLARFFTESYSGEAHLVGGAGENVLRIVTYVFIAMAMVCVSSLGRAQCR
jgi:hypothetical protein